MIVDLLSPYEYQNTDKDFDDDVNNNFDVNDVNNDDVDASFWIAVHYKVLA